MEEREEEEVGLGGERGREDGGREDVPGEGGEEIFTESVKKEVRIKMIYLERDE